MSFDQEYMHGYLAHENHFNKIAKKSYNLMGNITQCVIFEFDNTGHAFLAANRPDFGELFIEKKMYKVHNNIVYGSAEDKKLIPFFSSHCESLMFDKDILLFGKEFDMEHGFLYTEKLDDVDAFRMYAFASDSKQIYNVLANDFSKIQNFITSFAKESKDVINYYRERKFDLASQRNDYFAPAKNTQFSNNNKLINLLYTLGVLEDKSHISEIDWHCLKLHIYGNTINNISNTLDLPKITIEKAIHRLKSKIKVKNIEKILDYSS